MSEPVKVLPMAKLLRMAKEKEERERAEKEGAGKTSATAIIDKPLVTENGEPFTISELRENSRPIPEGAGSSQSVSSSGIVYQTIPEEDTAINENLGSGLV